MLDKLKQWAEKAARTKQVDIDRFNDPIASQTEWTPARRGGTNFRTHKLIKDGYNTVEFRATWGAKVFSSIFIIVGIAFPVGIAYSNYQNSISELMSDLWFMVIFGLIFSGVGAYLYYTYAKPIRFDKLTGNYWKGWKMPERNIGIQTAKNGTRMSNIYAIQLLSEYVRGDKKSYYSYELNLILKDGQRLHVVDHGNYSRLREDADTLSEFLGVPLWDAS